MLGWIFGYKNEYSKSLPREAKTAAVHAILVPDDENYPVVTVARTSFFRGYEEYIGTSGSAYVNSKQMTTKSGHTIFFMWCTHKHYATVNQRATALFSLIEKESTPLPSTEHTTTSWDQFEDVIDWIHPKPKTTLHGHVVILSSSHAFKGAVAGNEPIQEKAVQEILSRL
jgi:hypothetical protein